jgi:hypothetical protein
MTKYAEIQKYQAGGTPIAVAAPLESSEVLTTPQVNPEMFFQPFAHEKAESPEIDYDKLEKVDGPTVDKEKIRAELAGIKSTIDKRLQEDSTFLKTNEGMSLLQRTQYLYTTATNQVKEFGVQMKNAEAHMVKTGNGSGMAVTPNGTYVAVDATGQIHKNITEKDLLSGKYRALSNMEYMEARNSAMAGDSSFHTTIRNTIGIDEVRAEIIKAHSTLGHTSGKSSIYNTSRGASSDPLALLQDSDEMFAKYTSGNKSNVSQLKEATGLFLATMPPQAAKTLRAHAFQNIQHSLKGKDVDQQEIENLIQFEIASIITHSERSKTIQESEMTSSVHEVPGAAGRRAEQKTNEFSFGPHGATMAGSGHPTTAVIGGMTFPGTQAFQPGVNANNKFVVAGQSDAFMQSDRNSARVEGVDGKPSPELLSTIYNEGIIERQVVTVAPVNNRGELITNFSGNRTLDAKSMIEYSQNSIQLGEAIKNKDSEAYQKADAAFKKFFTDRGMGVPAGFSVVTQFDMVIPAVGEFEGALAWNYSNQVPENAKISDQGKKEYVSKLQLGKGNAGIPTGKDDTFSMDGLMRTKVTLISTPYDVAGTAFSLGEKVNADKINQDGNQFRSRQNQPSGGNLNTLFNNNR